MRTAGVALPPGLRPVVLLPRPDPGSCPLSRPNNERNRQGIEPCCHADWYGSSSVNRLWYGRSDIPLFHCLVISPTKLLLIVCRHKNIISDYHPLITSTEDRGQMSGKKLRMPSAELRQILAENIRAYRKSKRMSQEEFAHICNLHRTYVGSVERAERNVSLSTLEILSAALDVSVSELLTKRTFEDEQ